MLRQRSATQTVLPSIYEVLPEHFPRASRDRYYDDTRHVRVAPGGSRRQPRPPAPRTHGAAQSGRPGPGHAFTAEQNLNVGDGIDSGHGRPVDTRRGHSQPRLPDGDGGHTSHSSRTSGTQHTPNTRGPTSTHRPSPTSQTSSPASHPSDVPYPDSSHWSAFRVSQVAFEPRGHDDNRKYPCPHCLKRFSRPSGLAIHINIHTGAKPFECPRCGRTFSVNSNMRRHYRNHASTSPTTPRSANSLPSASTMPPYNPSPRYLFLGPSFHTPPLTSVSPHGDTYLGQMPISGAGKPGHSSRDLAIERSFARFRLGSSSPYSEVFPSRRDPSLEDDRRPESSRPGSASSAESGRGPTSISTKLRPAVYRDLPTGRKQRKG
ncbi:hypothetical protein AcW2_007005 [Taiwanofungus camphoratus]|nr:hypothetical protein AcW2_007005 [Antrodia cinnamomea]